MIILGLVLLIKMVVLLIRKLFKFFPRLTLVHTSNSSKSIQLHTKIVLDIQAVYIILRNTAVQNANKAICFITDCTPSTLICFLLITDNTLYIILNCLQ